MNNDILNVNLTDHVLRVFWPLAFGKAADYLDDILIDTGRIGGKSEFMGQYGVLRQLKNKDSWILCFRRHQNVLRGSSIKYVLDWINKLGVSHLYELKIGTFEIIRTDGDQGGFKFFGCDDENKIRSTKFLNGSYPLVGWFDEFQEFDNMQQLNSIEDLLLTFIRYPMVQKLGLRFQTIYCMNPKRNPNSPSSVWKQKIIEENKGNPRFLRFKTTYLDLVENDNPEISILPDQTLERIEKCKKNDPELYRWRFLGEEVGDTDVIFSNIESRAIWIDELPEHEYLIRIDMSVDTGYSVSNTAIQTHGVTNLGNYVALDGFYVVPDEATEKQKYPNELHEHMEFFKPVPSDFVAKIEKLKEKMYQKYGLSVKVVVYDNADSSLGNQYEREMGEYLTATNKAKKDQMIPNTQQFLSERNKIYFMKTGFNEIFMYEMIGYQYDPKTKGMAERKVIKDRDHSCDGLIYYVNDIWYKEIETDIEWR